MSGLTCIVRLQKSRSYNFCCKKNRRLARFRKKICKSKHSKRDKQESRYERGVALVGLTLKVEDQGTLQLCSANSRPTSYYSSQISHQLEACVQVLLPDLSVAYIESQIRLLKEDVIQNNNFFHHGPLKEKFFFWHIKLYTKDVCDHI